MLNYRKSFILFQLGFRIYFKGYHKFETRPNGDAMKKLRALIHCTSFAEITFAGHSLRGLGFVLFLEDKSAAEATAATAAPFH